MLSTSMRQQDEYEFREILDSNSKGERKNTQWNLLMNRSQAVVHYNEIESFSTR